MSRAGDAYAYEDPHDRAERIKRQRAERVRAEFEVALAAGEAWAVEHQRIQEVVDRVGDRLAEEKSERRRELARRPRPNRVKLVKWCEGCHSRFEANHRDARFCGPTCQKRSRRAHLSANKEEWHH